MLDHFSRNTLAPLVLRLALAAIFVYHGYGKISGEGNELGAAWYKAPDAPGRVMQLLVSWGELLGGVAVGLGLLTRVAALGLAVIMVGAIMTVTGANGFAGSPEKPNGYQFNMIIIAVCVALILIGGGAMSLDRILLRRRQRATPATA